MVQTRNAPQQAEEVVQDKQISSGRVPPDVPRNALEAALPADAMFWRSDEVPNPLKRIEDGLVDVPAEALRPTLLWRLFRTGARAVRVLNEPIVPQLWQDLMPTSPSMRETALGEILPWVGNLQSLARNFHPAPCVGQMVGDLFYARPPVLTYVARKMVVYRREGSGELVLKPEVMHQEGGAFRMPARTLRYVWELGTRLLEALSAPNCRVAQPAVALERLMYDASLEDLHQRVALVRKALGPWGQVGHRLDELWADTAAPFRHPLVHVVMTFGRLLPGLGLLLEKLNRYVIGLRCQELLPEGMELAGEAHTDNRLFSCLTSRRVGIRTEYFTGQRWRELPVTPDSLVIMPGNLARGALGLEPTVHRILHTAEGEAGLNVTILIGLSAREDA